VTSQLATFHHIANFFTSVFESSAPNDAPEPSSHRRHAAQPCRHAKINAAGGATARPWWRAG